MLESERRIHRAKRQDAGGESSLKGDTSSSQLALISGSYRRVSWSKNRRFLLLEIWIHILLRMLQYSNRRLLLLHKSFQRVNRTLSHKSNHGNSQRFRLEPSFAEIKVKLDAGRKSQSTHKRAQLLPNDATSRRVLLEVLTIHFFRNISISDLVIPPLRSTRPGTMRDSKLAAKFSRQPRRHRL